MNKKIYYFKIIKLIFYIKINEIIIDIILQFLNNLLKIFFYYELIVNFHII